MSTTQLLECQTCGAQLEVARYHRSVSCAYCASPSVLERPPTPDRPNPTFALGFKITRDSALTHARRWIRRSLLAPGAFRRAAVEATQGVYVPAYLYTAAAYSWYRAEIGEEYYEDETYETRNDEGEKVTETRQVKRHEWRSLSGDHAVYINDHVVTASRGLQNHELQGIAPFDLRSLQRFTPALISGWIAEDPSIGKHRSLEMARAHARTRLREQLSDFMPGDCHRLIRHHSEFHDEHMELALLPVWVLPVAYAADKPAVRLLVNGQTGQVFGRSPISIVKVIALAALAIAIALLIYFYAPPSP